MRITELKSDQPAEPPPSSDKIPKSLQNLKMFVIPVKGRGVAEVSHAAAENFTSQISLWVNGWLMMDGIVKPLAYNEDMENIVVKFSGTVPLMAPNWRLAQLILNVAQFEVMGQNIDGRLRDVTVDIGHVVNWCRPNSLEGWGLVGADR